MSYDEEPIDEHFYCTLEIRELGRKLLAAISERDAARKSLEGAKLAIEWWATMVDAKVTCLDCGLNGTCEFAWDPYNTDGDCLAEK